MPLKLNTASNGSVTIEPTNTASNFTLTVPAQTGTVVASNSSGNVGIGTTPSAWTSPDFLGLQVGSGVAVYGRGSGDADRGGVSTNAYNDGAWKYIATGNATRAEQTDGSHIWYTASSGTAGNSITFTSAMELDSSSNLKFNSGYGSVATAYGCRAWVNFNGTGTVAIRSSGNVSSITDNSAGDYTVNFTTALPDTNYATVLSNEANSGSAHNIKASGGTGTTPNVYTASAVRIVTENTDSTTVSVAVFR